MVTRFMSGLVVGLKRPDLATRVGILEQRAEGLGRRLDAKVLQAVAATIRGSAQQAEAATSGLRGKLVETACCQRAASATALRQTSCWNER